MPKNTKEWLSSQLTFANEHSAFEDCRYYPCHAIPEGQSRLNCFLCYCPFYPCGIERRGGKWLKTDECKVWDCTDCTLVHRDEVVKRIAELLYENKTYKEINLIIEKEY